MIAMMLPRPYIPLDSRLRGNDGGLGVCIPLAPLRFAKGERLGCARNGVGCLNHDCRDGVMIAMIFSLPSPLDSDFGRSDGKMRCAD